MSRTNHSRAERTRELARRILGHQPTTPDALHRWVRVVCQLHLPRRAFCADHCSPFDYLRASFFDQSDLLVWANRGGGKTTLAALACLLDAMFHGPLTAAVLAGSFDQADRLSAHLRALLAPHESLLEPRWLRDRLTLNQATVLTLAQSERAVRGLRTQKLRCDELDLFDRDVWRAAQFVTQSTGQARGSLEVFSTLHRPDGLMDELVAAATAQCQQAVADDQIDEGSRSSLASPAGTGQLALGNSAAGGFQLLRWCLWEVIERCGPQRQCRGCLLADDCGGRARQAEGFFRIDDAIAIKARVSRAAWESEMLCLRPRGEDLVFEEFRHAVHVKPVPVVQDWPTYRAIDFGYSAPLVCLWVQLSPGGEVRVVDEYVQARRAIEAHAIEIQNRQRQRGIGRVSATYVDPAGAAHEVATGAAATELLTAAGIPCTFRRSQLGDGLELIRQHLAPAAGRPTLIIDPRCRQLIRSFENYRYAPNTARPEKAGADHAIDALRYFFVNRMRPRMPVERGRY